MAWIWGIWHFETPTCQTAICIIKYTHFQIQHYPPNDLYLLLAFRYVGLPYRPIFDFSASRIVRSAAKFRM